MRLKTYTLTARTATTTDVSAAAAPTVNVPITLLITDLSANPRQLNFTSAGDASAVTFTIVGKDRWGNPTTEAVTGPNANTVSSKGIYSTITSITPSATSGQTVSAGSPQRICTPWVMTNTFNSADAVSETEVQSVSTLGTATAALEYCLENPGVGEIATDVFSTALVIGTALFQKAPWVRVVLTSAANNNGRFRFARPSI